MTDWLLGLVPTYGLWLLAATTFLSCLALPFPASIMMLTAGSFVGSGDLELVPTLLAAALGGILGDQLGFWAGRWLGQPLLGRLRADPARDKLVGRAVEIMQRRGVIGVFLSRWLFSPLGPWVNLTAGSTGYGWTRFALAGVAGELVWAGIYVGMGYGFSGSLEQASSTLGSALGLIAAATAMVFLGLWLRNAHQAQSGK